jgi:hypothetical protein
MFESLGSGRRRRRVPGWLLLLLAGVLLGAAGVIAVQERLLAPRLSAGESAALRQAYAQADAERQRLHGELTQAEEELQRIRTENGKLGDDLRSTRATVEKQRADLTLLVEALPPDPRGGSVEVRAGQFSSRDGALEYQVVLTRDGKPAPPLSGVLQLTVAGESAQGVATSVALKPIVLSLGRHEVLRGSAPLPTGFKPRQTTVQVLGDAGKPLGMRVLLVR